MLLQVEILEKAISSLRSRQAAVDVTQEETIRKLSAEVNQLKVVILEHTQYRSTDQDIYSRTSHDIAASLQQLERLDIRERSQEPAGGDQEDSLVFVAKIAQSNDHCYSMQVSEPSLEVHCEEVVEAEHEEQPGPTLVTLPVEGEQQLGEAAATFLLPDTVLHPLNTADNLGTVQCELAPLAATIAGANLTTIFVNKGSKASVLHPPVISTLGEDSQLVSKVAIPRLKVNRKAKPKRKTYTRKKCVKSIISEEKENEPLEIEFSQIIQPEGVGIQKTVDEVLAQPEPGEECTSTVVEVTVEGALLESGGVIDLQNREEIEILEETIKEDREQTEQQDCQAGMATQRKQSSDRVLQQETKKKVETNKKKSKSSYSIAALCQISVNIGDR